MFFPIVLSLIRHLLLPKSLRLSLARRSLNLRRLLKRTSPFLHLDPLKVEHLTGDLVPEVEVVDPPREEPPPLRNTEVQTPLPLPLPNIPVGGRLAHFAQNWAEITDDKWVLSLVRKGYRIPFLERPILSPNPIFFEQPLSQHLEEEVASLLSKGAVEEIIPECPGYYARDFLSLLGQLNAAADLVMLGGLHLRPLQISLRNQWKPQNLPYSHQIGMTMEILQHLKWWLQEDLYHQGIPLRIDPPSHTIFTDASLSGWGAHVEPEGLLFH